MNPVPSAPVFLPGWCLGRGPLEEMAHGINARIRDLPGYGISPLVENFDEAVHTIGDELEPQTTLIGWSLGAMIATAIAARRPEKVGRLVLVAGTASFIQRPGWPHALPGSVLDDFKSGITRDAIKTIPRFIGGFNRDDTNSKTVTQALLNSMGTPPSIDTLLIGLDWLGQVDLRMEISEIQCPTLLIHGSTDPLMPLSAAQSLQTLFPNKSTTHLVTLEACAHAPFASQPEIFRSHLLQFFDAYPQ